MSVWVKICGIRSVDALEAVIGAGADAVGFVFAQSPREVTLANALPLAERARGRVEIVVVMRHPAPTFAAAVCEQLRPDWLQTDAPDMASITLPDGIRRLPVYRAHAPSDAIPERLLFEGLDSGTGEVCDWSQARALARTTQLVLAGGLNPDNVADAIAQVRPFGVDVSSGVESERGVKDFDRIIHFVSAAREAAASTRGPRP